MSTSNTKAKQDIGALWERTTNSGETYFSGKITVNGTTVEIVVFTNKYASENEKAPTHRIYPSTRPAAGSPSPGAKGGTRPAGRKPASAPVNKSKVADAAPDEETGSEDVPF